MVRFSSFLRDVVVSLFGRCALHVLTVLLSGFACSFGTLTSTCPGISGILARSCGPSVIIRLSWPATIQQVTWQKHPAGSPADHYPALLTIGKIGEKREYGSMTLREPAPLAFDSCASYLGCNRVFPGWTFFWRCCVHRPDQGNNFCFDRLCYRLYQADHVLV